MSIDNVQDIDPRVQYTASAGQTVFPYPFPIFDDADLVVDIDGAITTDYTVSGAGDDNGGSVTLTSGASAGEVVTIYRDIAIGRDTDFQQNGPWRSAAINDDLDKLTLIAQQLESATTRAIRVSQNDTVDFDNLVLPSKDSRANKYPVFDNEGRITVSEGTGSDPGLRGDIATGNTAAVIRVTTVAAMKALTGLADGSKIITARYKVGGHLWGGATYTYHSTPTGTEDGFIYHDQTTGGGQFDLAMVFPNIYMAGASGNGVDDDTLPWQRMIAANPGGGVLYGLQGWFRVTDTLTMHSGLTFEGFTRVNLTFGTPTNAERPCHIFLDATNIPLFDHVFGDQLENVKFKDISLGARLFPTTTPVANTTCFEFEGSYPVDAKHIDFENVQFANFDVAVYINDPAAGGVNPDWNCAPVTFRNVIWYYCNVCVKCNTDNADMIRFDTCQWFIDTGDIGILVLRAGTMNLDNCNGGGGILLYFNGTSRDTTKLTNCQYESGTAMIVVDDSMVSQNTYRPIIVDGCTIESDIVLSNTCHFISLNNRYVNTVTADGDDVKIDSLFDRFIGGGPAAFNITGSNSRIVNFIAAEPTASGVRGPIWNEMMVDRGSAAPASGTYVAGDIRYNSSPGTGEPVGWQCVVSGSPGTWEPFGQVGYRGNAGSPVGVLTPHFVGEEMLNTSTGQWWKSVGTTSASWTNIG